ncbi:MAG TPA: glycoside hydrolase family 44 protein [Prolixibacteraceae bacterium]
MNAHLIKKTLLFTLLCFFAINTAFAQDVTISVDATQGKRAVSPYIYGRNNTFDQPAAFYKDVGLRFARMNAGNNATKYNWRRKITSHPDWYNNVYGTDWDKTSKDIAANHPTMQVMWAFQLLGRVASNTNNNFNDWGYNQSQYWQGVGQNLAGGGTPNTANPGGKALVEGDINLYTEAWPADSTVGILNHWFGSNGIGLNKKQFLYWNMDNEVDVWNGTHDDVMPVLIPASEFIDRFIEVAKKARALFPEIKICGPVTTSEWQWYKWGSEGITVGGKYYCWLEYFIKRLADEQKATGIKLLDVVDLHNYPYAPTDADALQNHRMYYDKNYVYPGVNGLKTINGGWDNSQTKEYIFQRINDWLTKYFGANHGITLGLSEWSPGPSDPNLASVIYASHLGTFANNGVEYLTPWTWFNGMWETLHLFSRYAKNYSVSSMSSLENTVSAYTTVNAAADSMTIIIVNRDVSSSRNVTVNLNGFSVTDGSYKTLQLASLPSTETFKSHTQNALKENSVSIKSNSLSLTVPALSTTAVLLKSTTTGISEHKNQADEIKIFPNPATDKLNVSISSNVAEPTKVTVFDQSGRKIQTLEINYDGYSPITVNLSTLSEGFYLLSVKNSHCTLTKSFTLIR